MVARCHVDTGALTITFSRDGADDITIEAADGERAILRVVTLLLAHKRLLPGDRIIVETAD